ncbi:hypothetical protein Pth03_49760 [Planotetraspora thailandica]|uniref:Uncharacterized protein n=1 Tax=Planotetraspora thailandica TaxID=487172 RepID=A0A8J3XVI4_9ACTN|nr:hypothetical protein [Planotetraspora thailandica]GII56587.1 hypothetical protein Pth03_49760 [Planotetraspora thailandica]
MIIQIGVEVHGGRVACGEPTIRMTGLPDVAVLEAAGITLLGIGVWPLILAPRE